MKVPRGGAKVSKLRAGDVPFASCTQSDEADDVRASFALASFGLRKNCASVSSLRGREVPLHRITPVKAARPLLQRHI